MLLFFNKETIYSLINKHDSLWRYFSFSLTFSSTFAFYISETWRSLIIIYSIFVWYLRFSNDSGNFVHLYGSRCHENTSGYGQIRNIMWCYQILHQWSGKLWKIDFPAWKGKFSCSQIMSWAFVWDISAAAFTSKHWLLNIISCMWFTSIKSFRLKKRKVFLRKRQTYKVNFNLQTLNPCTPSFPPLIIHKAQCAFQNVALRRGGGFPAGIETNTPPPRNQRWWGTLEWTRQHVMVGIRDGSFALWPLSERSLCGLAQSLWVCVLKTAQAIHVLPLTEQKKREEALTSLTRPDEETRTELKWSKVHHDSINEYF